MSDDNLAATSGMAAGGGTEGDFTLEDMWRKALQEIQQLNPQTENWKVQTLPLARIKKIMKSEEFILQELEKERLMQLGEDIDIEKPAVKFMISGEAPLLMTKACELLIRELSTRAWLHTERNRRRTLQRADVHAAVGESDVFDFLIDIIPRVATTRPAGPTPLNLPGLVDPQQLGGLLSHITDPAATMMTMTTSLVDNQLSVPQQPQDPMQQQYFFFQQSMADSLDGGEITGGQPKTQHQTAGMAMPVRMQRPTPDSWGEQPPIG